MMKKSAAKKSQNAEKPARARLGEFMGFSVVSVIRAMGKHGYDFHQAKFALGAEGIRPADQTIRIQLAAGRRGLGECADIPSDKLSALQPDVSNPEPDKGPDKRGNKASKKAPKATK